MLLAGCAGDGGGATVRGARLLAGPAPVLETELGLALTPAMREALDRGIALDLLFRLEGNRAGGRIVERRTVRLRWLPLANQYQVLDVARGSARQYASRAQLFAALDQVRLPLPAGWEPFARDADLRLQVWLERSALPGPLRLPALFSADWAFRTADHRWTAGG